MKSAIAWAVVGLVSLGFASSADAYKFAPPSESLSWTGVMIITQHGVKLGCTATIGGQTNAAGVLKITAISFSVGPGCSSVKGAALPWAVKATSTSTLTISRVFLTLPAGNCGPGSLSAVLGGGRLLYNNISNLGACSISGGLKTMSPIFIAP